MAIGFAKEKDLYILPKSNKTMTKEELVDMWSYLVNTYPISSIEDGMGEIDIEGWKLLTNKLSNNLVPLYIFIS